MRKESQERRNNVKKLALQYMNTNSKFPSSSVIHLMFAENGFKGSRNDINTDLQDLAKEISQICVSKDMININGEMFEIPKIAFEYMTQAYQEIKLHQEIIFDNLKKDTLYDLEATKQKLSDAINETEKFETIVKNKEEIIELKNEQIKVQKATIAKQEKEIKSFLRKIKKAEKINNDLNSEIAEINKKLVNDRQAGQQDLRLLTSKITKITDSSFFSSI